MLQAEKNMTVIFGPSMDPGGISIVDSVQVYGKAKDIIGWPEDNEDTYGAAQTAAGAVPEVNQSGNDLGTLLPVEKLTSNALGVLKGMQDGFVLLEYC